MCDYIHFNTGVWHRPRWILNLKSEQQLNNQSNKRIRSKWQIESEHILTQQMLWYMKSIFRQKPNIGYELLLLLLLLSRTRIDLSTSSNSIQSAKWLFFQIQGVPKIVLNILPTSSWTQDKQKMYDTIFSV